MHTTLKNIVEGKTVEVPTYDFVTHSRSVLDLCGVSGCVWMSPAVLGTCHLTPLPTRSGCFLLAGWRRQPWSIPQTLSSLRGSWFSTIKTSGTCSTCGSLSTRIPTSVCPAEVRLCPPGSVGLFMLLIRHVVRLMGFISPSQFCEI